MIVCGSGDNQQGKKSEIYVDPHEEELPSIPAWHGHPNGAPQGAQRDAELRTLRGQGAAMCKAKLPLRLGGQTRHLWRVEGTHCMARTHREIYNEEPDRIASTAEREKQELKEKSRGTAALRVLA